MYRKKHLDAFRKKETDSRFAELASKVKVSDHVCIIYNACPS